MKDSTQKDRGGVTASGDIGGGPNEKGPASAVSTNRLKYRDP